MRRASLICCVGSARLSRGRDRQNWPTARFVGGISEASRVVEVAQPARSRAWLWLLLPLLGLIALGLWYANRPPQTAVTPTMVTTTSLGGTRWHWERTRLSDGREQRPADSAAYALDFQRDGSAAVRADCNTAKGSYTTTGGALAIASPCSHQGRVS